MQSKFEHVVPGDMLGVRFPKIVFFYQFSIVILSYSIYLSHESIHIVQSLTPAG